MMKVSHKPGRPLVGYQLLTTCAPGFGERNASATPVKPVTLVSVARLAERRPHVGRFSARLRIAMPGWDAGAVGAT
jgi:hypothetical protein